MGAGPSTGKPFLNTNDLRSDLAKLISNKSSNFFWWTLIMILIFAIIVALSWYVFIEVEGGKFWNAEHKDIYYNRAIIGSTIGLHIVLGIILIYVSIEYYNLLKREDNFITDIAVLGDVSKLSANARPSLAAMIQGRLGESAKDLELPAVGELGQYLNRGSILGGASAASLLASNTLQQPQTVSQVSTKNIISSVPGLIQIINEPNFISKVETLQNKIREELAVNADTVYSEDRPDADNFRTSLIYSIIFNSIPSGLPTKQFDEINEVILKNYNYDLDAEDIKTRTILIDLLRELRNENSWGEIDKINNENLRKIFEYYSR